jgi:hypothetical protein
MRIATMIQARFMFRIRCFAQMSVHDACEAVWPPGADGHSLLNDSQAADHG